MRQIAPYKTTSCLVQLQLQLSPPSFILNDLLSYWSFNRLIHSWGQSTISQSLPLDHISKHSFTEDKISNTCDFFKEPISPNNTMVLPFWCVLFIFSISFIIFIVVCNALSKVLWDISLRLSLQAGEPESQLLHLVLPLLRCHPKTQWYMTLPSFLGTLLQTTKCSHWLLVQVLQGKD